MKTKLLLLLLFQIPFLVNSLPAEDASHLSLGEVTRVAVAHNPSIAEARQKWEAARKRVVQEGAWDDLKVSANSVTARFVDIAPNSFTDQSLCGTSCSRLGKEPIARAHRRRRGNHRVRGNAPTGT